jgi:hypothetical protein
LSQQLEYLLDLVSEEFANIISKGNNPYNYHPSLTVKRFIASAISTCSLLFFNYVCDGYAMIYKVLSSNVWYPVSIPLLTAVNPLILVVPDAWSSH